jgi:transposase
MQAFSLRAILNNWMKAEPMSVRSLPQVLKRGTREVINRAANGLTTRGNDPDPKSSYLGPQYRRLRTKLGAPKAITAMAHRLARLAYRMLKYGQEYVDKGAQFYEQRLREQQLQLLKKKAVSLGLQLVPTEDVG